MDSKKSEMVQRILDEMDSDSSDDSDGNMEALMRE